ncbi:hypothetical protein BGY98DRAFT_1190766 [Russula aff. rugulosa BPL654]|nr:hypothetical protein BGY98DRAFT_1190766 [Russula aff. rugulosa BPL654]
MSSKPATWCQTATTSKTITRLLRQCALSHTQWMSAPNPRQSVGMYCQDEEQVRGHYDRSSDRSTLDSLSNFDPEGKPAFSNTGSIVDSQFALGAKLERPGIPSLEHTQSELFRARRRPSLIPLIDVFGESSHFLVQTHGEVKPKKANPLY